MRKALRENGLSIVIAILFTVFLVGQTITGWHAYNEEQRQHGNSTVTLGDYLTTGHFIEATAENWESEFLQMAAYVLLTVMLFQKGSSESKKLDEPEEVDRDPRATSNPDAPSPVRRGGWVLWLYERSLSLAFVVLFLASLAMHAAGGVRAHNEQAAEHGERMLSLLEYVGTPTFWFESFQNWQSEFLALFCMVVLSIYLRQRGSPESKPVDAPHHQTGAD